MVWSSVQGSGGTRPVVLQRCFSALETSCGHQEEAGAGVERTWSAGDVTGHTMISGSTSTEERDLIGYALGVTAPSKGLKRESRWRLLYPRMHWDTIEREL